MFYLVFVKGIGSYNRKADSHEWRHDDDRGAVFVLIEDGEVVSELKASEVSGWSRITEEQMQKDQELARAG